MQTKNYKGQDLRGRSFKNQDLTGADFSDADVRGCDFSGTELGYLESEFNNDAQQKKLICTKFCRARMGKTWRRVILLLLLNFLIGMLAGLFSTTGNFLCQSAIGWILERLAKSAGEITNSSICAFYTLGLISATLIALKRQNWAFISKYFGLTVIGVSGLILLIIGELGGLGELIRTGKLLTVPWNINTITMMFSLIILILSETIKLIIMFTLFLLGSVVSIVTAAGIVVLIGVNSVFGAIAGIIGVAIIIAPFLANQYADEMLTSPIITICYLLLGIYLHHETLQHENPMLLWLRRYALSWRCWGGTNFEHANLTNADFSEANLKYARFSYVKSINHCIWKNAKNHYLAKTRYTLLEPRKVRDLVIDGIITDKNFSTLDLRGLDFSNLNLQDFDFSHANLSGANLSHTQLTGAILEGWNIDTETCLDDIDCRYYFYLEKGEKKRMPPEGEEYSAGEFTRIFQKIANTIDFIAHNEMELAAIKLSVEQVRVESGNDDIRVQAIEEKDGFIVVKVTVPKTEDRGVLYHEVNSLKQEYETKIQSLMAEKHIQIGKIEVLKEQIKEQRDDFLIKIQQEGKIIMNNPSISTTITGSTVHGSVVTAEKIENSFNTVQDTESQTELKQLLGQLQTLINNSSLPDTTKQKALSKTENIAVAVNQPEAEQKNIVQKTLGYFDGLADSLESVPETALKLGETVAKIGLLFGI